MADEAIPRPFEGRYGVTLALAILALVPFIIGATAYALFRDQLTLDLGANATDTEVVNDLATAAYAFGALLGGGLIQYFEQRYLFLGCEALFVAGSLLAASASHVATYGSGVVLEGFATGLLLVVALPPVIRRFPPERLPTSAAVINLGFFGAITLGPLVGGLVSASHSWHWFYVALALVGMLVLLVATFTLPNDEPPNPTMRFDREGVLLALLGTALPFFAAGELTSHGFTSAIVLVPFAVGIVAFVAMLVVECCTKEPISPVKRIDSTLPVVGIIVSSIGGGIYITLVLRVLQFETTVRQQPALSAGFALWPQVVGVLIASFLLGKVLKTRFLALFALTGMLAILAGASLLLRFEQTSPIALLWSATALLGLGAGATVAPGLWFAGMSVESKLVGRIIALVELIRSMANFIMAPVLIKIAITISGGGALFTTRGFHASVLIALGATAIAVLIAVTLYVAGGPGLQRPDIRRWLKADEPAFESPELFALLRGRQREQPS